MIKAPAVLGAATSKTQRLRWFQRIQAPNVIRELTPCLNCSGVVLLALSQQQQQQHSLLSQASWGRLEMKPKRDEKTISSVPPLKKGAFTRLWR
jgi:hypothetical protein